MNGPIPKQLFMTQAQVDRAAARLAKGHSPGDIARAMKLHRAYIRAVQNDTIQIQAEEPGKGQNVDNKQ